MKIIDFTNLFHHFLISFWVLIEKIYQTSKTVFDQISKQLKVHKKITTSKKRITQLSRPKDNYSDQNTTKQKTTQPSRPKHNITMRHIFNSLLVVWKCGQTWSLVFVKSLLLSKRHCHCDMPEFDTDTAKPMMNATQNTTK